MSNGTGIMMAEIFRHEDTKDSIQMSLTRKSANMIFLRTEDMLWSPIFFWVRRPIGETLEFPWVKNDRGEWSNVGQSE